MPLSAACFRQTPEIFADIIGQSDRGLRKGFEEVDRFIFSFGMNEIFHNRTTAKNGQPDARLWQGGDGRHVQRPVVDAIPRTFVETYFSA